MIKKLFSLFAAILFAGSMMAGDVNDTIRMIGFAGETDNSLVKITKSGTSAKDVAMVAFGYNGSTGSVRGNKTAVAGASVTTADDGKNWSLYNSAAMPGAIKAIKVIQTATGNNKFQNHLYVSLGTSTQGAVTSIENAQVHSSLSNSQIDFTIDGTKGYTYFKLLSTEKFTSNTVTGVEVIVTYEESGDVIVKTLKSIAVSGMTTEYEQNETFSFDGTCTATYSVTKNDVPQDDEVKNVTPTSVSSPDMTTTGEKEITVSFTDGGVTKTAKYNINVTPELSKSTLTFAAACGGSGTASTADGLKWTVTSDADESVFDNNRGIHYGTGSAAVSYVQLSSAPFYKNIRKIEVEAAGGNSPSLAITIGGVMFGDSAKNITNSNVKYTFQPTNEQSGTDFYGNIVIRLAKASSATGGLYVKSVVVKYEDYDDQVLNIAECENGSVSASVSSAAVASGDEVAVGATVNLSNTPASGHKFLSYDVYKTGATATKVTVTNGSFLMPPYPVTISASFEAIKTLSSIEITSPATQTTFWQGETFNSTGLEITAHYDDESSTVVTPTSVTGSTAVAGNNVAVTISYEEGGQTKETSYSIVVRAIPNTAETAFTVAEARDIIDKLETAEGVYVTGLIQTVSKYNNTGDNAGSINYWISDDGTATGRLQVYAGKGLSQASFSAKEDLSVGDSVTVVGNLKLYESTYEFDKGNYLAARTPVHTVTIKATENGTLVVKKAGVAINSGDKVLEGTTLTIEATPDPNYKTALILVNTTQLDLTKELSFTMPAEDVEVDGEFTHSGWPTALDDTELSNKAVKFIQNGQLFIELNGHIYNVQGQVVK